METTKILEQMWDRDWTEADLRLAAQLLGELERSPEALDTLRDGLRLRNVLRSPSPDAEPSRGWRGFEQGLLTAVAPPSKHFPMWASVSRITALAAMLALAVTGWLLYFQRPPVVVPALPISTSNGNFARMTPTEVTQQTGLFDKVSEVFDDRAKWVAVSDGAAEMGLAPMPMPISDKPILLRLAVLRGGQLRSRSDVAIMPGQDADMTLPFEQGQRVRYRISATATHPMRLSLWVELQKPGVAAQTLAALATEISARPGDLIKAGELSTSSGQYQFQVGFFEASQTEASR